MWKTGVWSEGIWSALSGARSRSLDFCQTIGKKLFFGVFLNLCWHQQEMESIIIWNIFTHSPDPIGLIYQVSSHLTICSKFDKCFYATAFSFHFHFTTADVSKYISRINSIIVKTHSIRSSRYCKFLARFNRVQPLLPK